MANNCMHFHISDTYSPVNREKYAPMLSILKKEFENKFKYKKIHPVFVLFAALFSVLLNTLPVNFQCIELQ